MKKTALFLLLIMLITTLGAAFSVSAENVNYDIFNVEFSEMEFGTTGTHLNQGQSKVFVSGTGGGYVVENSKLTVDALGGVYTDLDFDLNSSKTSYRLSISLNVSTDTTDEIFFTFGNTAATASNRYFLKIAGGNLYLKSTDIADITYGEDCLIDFILDNGKITVLVNGETKVVNADESTYVYNSSRTNALEAMRVRVGSTSSTNAKVTLNYIKASSSTEYTQTNWDTINYDFTTAPSGVINEGTVANGILTIEGTKSFYSAPASTTLTKFVSEISVKAVSGWVNIYFTNKISGQGYHIQVRNDGDVLLFGGSGNAYIDAIGKYDTSGFAKILFELDTENDIIKISLDGATAKEYVASTSAYYSASNTDAKGYSRVLIAGHNASSVAQVDYIKVSTRRPTHIHAFNKNVIDDKYLVPGNGNKVEYYNSCECGEGSLSDDAKFTVCGIMSAQPMLGSSISMMYNVDIPSSIVSVPQMKFTFNDEEYYVDGTLDDEATGVVLEGCVRYIYTLDEIAPQCMGNLINATITIGDYTVYKNDYSVEIYCREMLEKADSSAELKTLLNDMLVYGGAAQNYLNYNTDSLVSNGITGTTFVPLQSTDKQTSTKIPEAYIAAAALRFDNTNKIRFKIVVADKANITNVTTVKVDGLTVSNIEWTEDGDGAYAYVYTDEITAVGFDELHTAELTYGDATQEVSYSVRSYVYSKQEGTDNTANLVKALYNYGLSANTYVKSVA